MNSDVSVWIMFVDRKYRMEWARRAESNVLSSNNQQIVAQTDKHITRVN